MYDLPLKKVNEEVYIATDGIVRLDLRAIEFIKEKASDSSLGRARICAHKCSQDTLHEMLIAIQSCSYIRPHRHFNKIESFHLIEGRADVIIFSDDGCILDVVKLGKEYNFYYRLDAHLYHTLIIYSPMLVIHETTNGPFNVNDSDYAKFSPEETNKMDACRYIENLKKMTNAE